MTVTLHGFQTRVDLNAWRGREVFDPIRDFVTRGFDGEYLRPLARQTRGAAQRQCLSALASINDGATRLNAARLGNVTLQIVRDWVWRFNELGPARLVNRKAPGQQSGLASENG